jgi:limonene-1,2-epoxide hydrolase
MSSPKQIITKFYKAFDRLDPEGMAALYDEQIIFSDPAFGKLSGIHAGNMWRMLCKSQKGKDFRIEASNIHEENGKVMARWDAYYTFSQTGRKVHNIIYATFEFSGNKIIRHQDHFNLYRWSIQALGFQGLLIGWSGFFKKKLQSKTRGLLSKFEEVLDQS